MPSPALAPADAATALGLPLATVDALIDGGYLATDDSGAVPVAEIKAFLARNSTDDDEETARELLGDIGALESGAEAILDALEASIHEMAERTADVFTTLFPDAAGWTPRQREAFEEQAADRFAAILTVTRRHEILDDDLVEDLADAGGAAAFAGAPLPQVLMTLRISRDMMVQTAVTAAEERGRTWGLALAVVLTRVLPVLDHLLDSVARGYWEAVLTREQEAWARFESVVERSASGVYEVDLDGHITYCNESMATIIGCDRSEVDDEVLGDLLPPFGDIPPEIYLVPTDEGPTEFRVTRLDGVTRTLSLHVIERREDGLVVGYDGVARDVTSERDLEHQKNDFLALMTHELRQPLTTILGLGATLESHAAALPADRLVRMGASVHDQARRMARLADDLYDVSRLQVNELDLSLRRLRLAPAIEAGLAMLPDTRGIDVDVVDDPLLFADGRRLEQVVAHLVENALVHGAAPVRVVTERVDDMVEIRVEDRGPGIDPTLVPGIFAQLRPTGEGNRLRDRSSGLGLPLARGLVEAMGGRLTYRPGIDGGAVFVVTLPIAGI